MRLVFPWYKSHNISYGDFLGIITKNRRGNFFKIGKNPKYKQPYYYVWFFFLLAAIGSQAAPTSSSEIEMGNGNQAMNLLSLLDSRMENTSIVTYSMDRFEVKTFVIMKMRFTMNWIQTVPSSQSGMKSAMTTTLIVK